MRIPLTILTPARGCDCSRCPFFIDNPNAAEPICSGSNSDCSYCGCARTADNATPDCGQCSVRCGSRTDITAWMADAGGTLAFDDITLDGLNWPQGLPQFIPQIDTTNTAELDTGLNWPAYALGLRRVFSPKSWEVLPGFTNITARDALGLSEGQRAVLVGYGEDPLVEAFWTRRHNIYPMMAQHQWDLVLSPNFSMYGNQPRAEHLLNFRRNLLIAEEMLAAGINAAPNIYWYRLEDLQRYGSWLQDVEPPAISINLQTFRTDSDWTQMALPGLAWLSASLPAHTKLVVVGASRKARIAELTELYGDRITLISQNPVQYARHGAIMGDDGREDIHADVATAFAATVRWYASLFGQTA
ncbi:DUF4417 domain-containing protein [Mycobacteroides chelonae]|uniref:DUF4417 domain-containing protein n=1 Tax=Mycobacteroides chelonae TaxID=1774 RepID=UPI0008A84444|nr:DUF4417 domain-containing protein [Mycobacteroides chelonae]OHU12746.1 hypothetical protein BKG75_17160 [Mycobacteroides chelonae]